MNSKEALEQIKHIEICSDACLDLIDLVDNNDKKLFQKIEQDLERLEKYKKAIELLKKYVGFKLVIDSVDGVRGITIKYEYSDISKKEYELLEEVLDYDREK